MEFAGLLYFLVLIYYRPQDFMEALYNWRLVYGALWVTTTSWLFRRTARLEERRIVDLPQDWFMIGFWLATILSTFTLNWLWYTRDVAIKFGKLALIYFLIADILNTENRVRKFTYILMLLTTMIAGMAVLQRFGIDITGVGMILDKEGVYRVQGAGIYHNPNYLAYSLILIVPLQYWFFRRSPSFTQRLFSLLSLSMSFWCIILTKSRGGMLCLLATMTFVISQGRKSLFKLFIRFAGIAIIPVLFAVGPRFETLYLGEKTIEYRIDAWYGALELLKQYPLIGVGIEQFNEYHPKVTTHGSFPLVGAEMGLFGLFMWLGFLYWNVKLLYMYDKEDKFNIYVRGLLGSIVAYLFMSFFASFSYRITLFIVGGLAAAVIRLIRAEERPEFREAHPLFTLTDLRNIAFLEVGVIVLWHLVIKYGHYRG